MSEGLELTRGGATQTGPSADGAGAPLAVLAYGVSKQYIGGDGKPLQILQGVELAVERGEVVAIIGQSGAGKSTLLQVIGGLDRPSAGTVEIGGQNLSTMPEERLTTLRNRSIGFVFQFHHLLREFTALENVTLPLLIGGENPGAAYDRGLALLDQVGLSGRLSHRPNQLSGGEQQRVAVARALANRPVVLLADEPSGNLDPPTGELLHDLLFQVCREEASAMVVVTHNMELAARADRVLRLQDSRLVPAWAPTAAPTLTADESL